MYQDSQQNLQNPMVNPQFYVQQPQQNMQQPFPPQQPLDSQQNWQNLQAPLVNPQFQQQQAQVVSPLTQQQQLEKGDYQMGLCSCFENMESLIFAYCLGHLGLAIMHAFAVDRATQKQTGCCCACLLELVCCPCINRSTIREAYNIKGTCCEDFLLFIFCTCCAYLQDINEVKRRSGEL